MSASQQQAAVRALAGVGFTATQAQELYRLFLATNQRFRENQSQNPTPMPDTRADLKLVGIQGSTTLKSGDGVTMPVSRQLPRLPRETNQGGQRSTGVSRVEMLKHKFRARVVEMPDAETVTAVLMDSQPPQQEHSSTGLQVSKSIEDEITDDLSTGSDTNAVTVKVYADDPSAPSYSVDDIIEVERIMQDEVRTTHSTDRQNKKNTIVTRRTLSTEYFHNRNCACSGGGE